MKKLEEILINGKKLKTLLHPGSDLSYQNLIKVEFKDLDLRNINFNYSNLCKCIFINCDLSGSNFKNCNVTGVEFINTKLNNVLYNEWTAGLLPITAEGRIIGYKKAITLQGEEVVIKLEIPEDSFRCNATSRKCRCNKAKVIYIENIEENKRFTSAVSSQDKNFIYTVNEMIEVKNYDKNRWNEYCPSIHFFLTKKEAKNY